MKTWELREKAEQEKLENEFRDLIMDRLYGLAHMIQEDENFKYRMNPQGQVNRAREELNTIQSIISDFIIRHEENKNDSRLPYPVKTIDQTDKMGDDTDKYLKDVAKYINDRYGKRDLPWGLGKISYIQDWLDNIDRIVSEENGYIDPITLRAITRNEKRII